MAEYVNTPKPTTHLVTIAFDINDDEIRDRIEANVEKHVIREITEKIESVIYEKQSSYFSSKRETISIAPLKSMVLTKVDAMIEAHKAEIIEAAADRLADRLARTQAAKSLITDLQEALNEKSKET